MARGVSPSGAAKPLADEAITTTLRPPRVSLMLFIVARCHCPRRADVPGRRYPPPPREDRAVLAQADLRPAGPAGLIYLRYVTETVGRDEPAGHRQPAGADRVGPGRPAGRGPRPGRHLDQSAGVAEQRAAPPHRRGRPLPRGATPSSASWRRAQALRLNRRAARVTAGCIKVGFPESYGRESAPGWTVTEPGAQTGSGMRRAARTV